MQGVEPMTDQNKEPSPRKSTQASLGVVLWLATDTFVFFPVFIGAGLSIGLALDNTRSNREEE
jgi:hypothetical protein